MMRQFVPLACLGTVLLPAGALAIGWRTYYPPCVPVVSCPPVVYYPVCPPACEVYAPAPIYAPAPAPAPSRPAAPTVTQEPTARPEAAKPDAPVTPAPTAPTPKAPVAPMPGVPRTALDEPEGRPAEAVRIPATVVPLIPSVPLAQPRAVEPTGAVLPVPKTPTLVPAAEPGRFPLVPRVPGGEGGLPPLQIVPPAEPSTSRSSPLTDRKAFEVVPVSGAAPAAGALRSVGIFNHTDRDVTLTVEGETVTLPKRSYVTAAVPRKFAWKLGDGESQTTEVPPSSPGVEIVLRR